MKIKYNSPVVLTFAIISFFALVLNYLTGGMSNNLLFVTYFSSLLNPLTYVRLFTHVLGHANWSHFFGNMLLFLLVGPMLEEKYGSKKILFVILITAFVTAVINGIFFNTGLLGASGIVFAFIMMSSMTAVKEKEIPLTFIIVLIMYVGKEVINIFTVDNVSQFAHLVGGACGSIFGFINIKKNRL